MKLPPVLNPTTGTDAVTLYYEDGEQVYPCRCGETHRGPYAMYDELHHDCYHRGRLITPFDPKQVLCSECGESFRVEGINV